MPVARVRPRVTDPVAGPVTALGVALRVGLVLVVVEEVVAEVEVAETEVVELVAGVAEVAVEVCSLGPDDVHAEQKTLRASAAVSPSWRRDCFVGTGTRYPGNLCGGCVKDRTPLRGSKVTRIPDHRQ